MSSLDPTVASILDRSARDQDSDEDEDALIAALEEDEESNHELTAFREQRLQQLHAEYSRAKQLKESGAGTYLEVKEEKPLMDLTTANKYVVVHFFKPDFGRCGVMDGHLEQLPPLHLSTRFLRINVENCPFLVTKLKIQVLPCVISFIDGIAVDRIVGFEGLGRGDRFTTRELEARLLASGVLERGKLEGNVGSGGFQILRGKQNERRDEEEEFDSD